MTTQPHCITCGKSHNGEFCENPIPVMTPRKQGANMRTQPQQGQYWQTQDGKLRAYVHGVTKLGTVLAEMPCGQWVDIDVNQMLADWRHLPDCDSFDWQPTRYPRYWETHDRAYYAFLRQDSETEFVLVEYDGTDYEGTEVTLADRAELTEAEAMSRIERPRPDPGQGYRRINPAVDVPQEGDQYWDKKHRAWLSRYAVPYTDGTEYRRRIESVNPVESPDDWVTQDRVVPRNNIDLWCWIDAGKTPHEHDWQKGVSNFHRHKHGDREYPSCSEILHVRCRRKDLPPAEPRNQYAHESAGCPVEPPTPKKTRTITFCEHVVWDDPGCERLVWALESDDLLYRYRYPTGLVRTVEVPE